MKKQNIIEILSTFLLVMFLYTAFSKYFDWTGYKRGMHNQHFSDFFTGILIFAIPPIEIVAGVLLIFTRTRLFGLYLSLLLMAVFTGYVGLVLIGYFSKYPCPCGGAFKEISWLQHFFFNLFFLVIAFTGLLMQWSLNRHQRVLYSPR